MDVFVGGIAKVNNFENQAVGHDDVGRVEVTMDDILTVQVAKSIKKLAHKIPASFLAQTIC